ncbi:MAG TPA: MBL fold metallo-hydrolase [Petrotogaceae bacterium]|jgi:ribonuclease BN (tRNA processing enzyme)|nr:MBL fold metallo-hydrolase [Petrotogaceae bacterium]HNV04784.1 MBL fold metallo-hydrolase [Petrotogaceae bacterium]HPG47642.1 MBL fold metallo-hydrolase [Petrotogaceae bacterium]HPO26659.1 MBL fold metallo-hydrolase [Petrotogaceae bacterium]
MRLDIIGYCGAYPGNGQPCSGYLVTQNGTSVLLDCGSGVLTKIYDYIDPERINHVIITHFHADHFSDVFCMQHLSLVAMQLGRRKEPLRVYAPADEEYFEKMKYKQASVAFEINSQSTLDIDSIRISFLKNNHVKSAYAVKVLSGQSSLVYTSDTQWCDGLVDFARGCDVLLCESSLYNEFYNAVQGHMTAGECGLLASKCGAGRLILTHLPHYGEHEVLAGQAREKYDGPVILAENIRYLDI